MFFKPAWVKILQEYMRPDNNKIEQLEKLRTQSNIPHDIFAMKIASSPVTTRKVQKYFLEEYRRQVPNASEKELWMMVLMSRMDTHKNKILTDVSMGSITPQEAEEKFNRGIAIIDKYEEVIESINSFDALCDYIVSLDEMFVGESYSSKDSIGDTVNKILEG